MDNNFLIIGNDEKMKSCQKRLDELKFKADCLDYNTQITAISKYKKIILPLPTVKDGKIAGTDILFDEFCRFLEPEQTVFCGNISPKAFPCHAFSYYSNEAFLTKNSRLTAQGTLMLILENIRTDLSQLAVAVIGYGRCGKEICTSLMNNGADVTSFSRRKETLELAENNGLKSQKCSEIELLIQNYDIIINTVPCNLISHRTLEQLSSETIYIEVASKPYGIDISQAESFSFRYVSAAGLPGRVTPIGAGINIADTIAGMIKEE